VVLDIEDVMRRIRSVLDMESPELEEGADRMSEDILRLGSEDQRKCLLLLYQIEDQKAAALASANDKYEVWRNTCDLLVAKGLGSPGFERIKDVWPFLNLEERLVVDRGFLMWKEGRNA